MSAVTVVSSPASLIQRRRTPTKKFTQTCGLNPRQLPMRRPHQPKSPERAQRRSLRSRRSLMSVQEVVGLAVEGGAPGGRGGVGPAFRSVGVALEGPSNLSRALLSSQSGWCTRYGRSAGTSRVSPEGLLGVDSGNQLSVVCGPGVRARGVDVRPTGGGRHRAVRYQGTSAVVGQGYLEAALSCTCHCLQPAWHTPAFPVLQSPCQWQGPVTRVVGQRTVASFGLARVLSHFSRVQLFATPGTVACQALLSMGFSRQEYWSGLPFSSPGESS